ncbi:isopentenyl-diphosphate Delta-isomerase [Sediminibacterium sp.]|uniref:isopentenyl-diphosphate Delta-isomerase n=1 Tax=Sediminibacterium sp. TaxID=1917865 RepID=UPI0025E8A758|nr:isopentenyl-diphosphate Delta-isomerase [Sediminibacterium sp.]MBW0178880.1 isopentenyl-diphosphate Delta-isomerase [Sediminibacterium sp.]
MEHVILVNEQDEVLGVMEKMEAHEKAQLHRAFSVFVFNTEHQLLLQKRALTKYHSGGLWTNTCCSHPRPGELTATAAQRRLREEMGFTTELSEAFSFIYKTSFANGLTEYEFDHVFAGTYNGIIHINSEEVDSYAYRSLEEIASLLEQEPDTFTAWFHIAFPKVHNWYLENHKP